jgi:Malectin domain
MGTKKCMGIRICLAVATVAWLTAARSASGQALAVAPIRYIFGTKSFTDSKGQIWSPVPTSELPASLDWHWSSCAKDDTFAGTADPGLYREQIAEDTGDMVLTVPVPSSSYIVNLYFAEPCSYTAGERVFGIALNGSTVVPRLDLAATAGAEKSVIESATVNGSEVRLDLKPITDEPVIAAIEILPKSSSSPSTSSFQLTTTLKWDDGTPVAGTVVVAQEISINPVASKSLGGFLIDGNGAVTASLTPDLTLPLTFSFTLMNPAGVVVNTLKFSCDMLTLKTFPHTLSPAVVLNKSSATLKSFSF